MAETDNIKRIGELVAEEIFSTFNWEKCNFQDNNWKCETPKKHRSAQAEKHTHPSDAVFYYFDPYRGKTIYLNFDFKSYAKSSLESYKAIKDLRSLGKALECANISEEFKNLYVKQGDPHFIDGVLFVYNHDGEYDKDFDSHLSKQIPKSGIKSLKGSNRLFVLGPQDIVELYSIANHFTKFKGTKVETHQSSGFYSPDLQISKVQAENKVGPATIEMLTSPWIISKVIADDITILVYLKAKEMSIKAFKYLLDAILQFQLLDDNYSVLVIDIYSSPERIQYFNSAQREYAENSHGVNDESIKQFKTRLSRISYHSSPLTKPSFFELEVSRNHE